MAYSHYDELQQKLDEASETPVMLPLSKLVLDDSLYHKHIDNNKLAKMYNKFNPNKFHPVLVGERKGDAKHYYIIDGHHRCIVAKSLGHTEIECHVLPTMCQAEEMYLYLKANQ